MFYVFELWQLQNQKYVATFENFLKLARKNDAPRGLLDHIKDCLGNNTDL